MPSKPKTTPEWAQFLLRELPNLENLSIKRLRTLAKKAHLNAAGGKLQLVSKLYEFVSLEEPPDWFVQEKKKLDLLVEIRGDDKSCYLKIGQFLKVVCTSTKMRGRSVHIDKDVPAECVKLYCRHSPGLSVGCSGYSTQIFKVVATCPGTANLVFSERSGAISDMKPFRTVKITVTE
jgi:hypothetical protein